MQFQYLTTLLALTGAALSVPTATKCASTQTLLPTKALLDIMPSSSSCANRGDECRTAAQAAPYLRDAMIKYNTTQPMEKAGILSIIAYESEEMRYKKNLNNAAAGQGTCNQQMGNWNVQYANSLPELKAKNPTESTVLDMVIDDQYNFGTGSWFYDFKCKDARSATSGPADAWFDAYMACVGVNASDPEDPDQLRRITYWQNAAKAFSVPLGN